MHASNLLKAVLKPQAPSSGEKSPVTASAVPCAKISSKKSAKKTMVSTSAPVKMTCLCAPTKHAGSFRCRLHRSQTQWGGRPMPSSPPKTEDVEVVLGVSPEPRTSSIPEMILKPVVSLPAPPPNSLTRSPPRGASRLNRMAIASQSEETDVLKPLTNEEHLPRPVKMATGSGVSYTSSRGSRPLVFPMIKNVHDGTKFCL
ncbi:unnamed protein product [Sphagnum compactum]